MSIIETLREKRAQKAKMDKGKKAKAEKILKKKADAEIATDAEIAKKILKEMKASNISSFNKYIKDVYIQLKDLSKKPPDAKLVAIIGIDLNRVTRIDLETFNDCKVLAEKYALPITTQVLRGDAHHQSSQAFDLFSHLIRSYYHDICEAPENKVIIDEIIGERPSNDSRASECADFHRDRGRYFKFSSEDPWPYTLYFKNFPLFFSFEASVRHAAPTRQGYTAYLDSDYLLQFTFNANNILHLDEYIQTYKESINDDPVRFREKLRLQLVQKLRDSPIVNERRFDEELDGDFYSELIGYSGPHPAS